LLQRRKSDQALNYSIIIPAKDAERTIADCLNGAIQQAGFTLGIDYEIIVVDDGSIDQTVEIVKKYPVRYLHQNNQGPASARNSGAKEAVGEILLFTDADCVPAENWLEQMVAPLADVETVGVKGTYKTRQKGFVPRFVQLEYGSKYEGLKQKETIDFIDTYSAAYRKKVFLEAGGFDVRFPVPSVEDQELSFRLAKQGCKLIFQPDAAVYHQHDLNLSEYWQRKFGIGYWKAYMLRWLPEKIFSDSYTPFSQRLQIGLLPFMLAALIGAFYFSAAGWIFGLFAVMFLVSGTGVLKYIWQHDRPIALIFPGMLFVRAVALGCGLFCGFIFPPKK